MQISSKLRHQPALNSFVPTLIIIIALIIVLFIKVDNYSESVLTAMEGITIFSYVVVFFSWYKKTHKIASLFFVFLIMCFMFNAGQILLGLFDVSFVADVNIYQLYSNKTLIEMMLFQSKCVLAFGLGGCLAYNKKAYEFENTNYLENIKLPSNNGTIGKMEFLYLGVYVLMFASYLRQFITRSGTSYGDYYYGERESVGILLIFAYHVVFFNVFMRHDKDMFSKVLLWSNIALLFIMLMIGSRNVVLQLIFGCFFILMYVKRNNTKIPLKKLIALILIGLVLLIIFTGLQEIRQVSFSSISLDMLKDIYVKSVFDNLVGSLVQMGGSARCTLSTMIEIKSGRAVSEPSILYALAKGIIPIQLLPLLGFKSMTHSSLAAWITKVGGSQAGWGYSIIAELFYDYKDLGWILAILLAFLYVKLEQKSLKLVKEGRFFYASALIYVLAYAIFIARADMILISSRIRYCVYVAIVSYLIKNYRMKKTFAKGREYK